MSFSSSATVGSWTFTAGAAYSFTNSRSLTFTDQGILIIAGSASITNTSGGTIDFLGGSTAGSATITNDSGGTISFFAYSTAGGATIANTGNLNFNESSTAASASITNNFGGTVNFLDSSTAGSATIANNGAAISFYGSSTAGSANIANTGNLHFRDSSTAGSAGITNTFLLDFVGISTAGSANITNNSGGIIEFWDVSTAGSATITNSGGGIIDFLVGSTAGSATITNASNLSFDQISTAGSANITNTGNLNFNYSSSADSAKITNNIGGTTYFYSNSTAGSAAIANTGNLRFSDNSTAGNAAITNGASGATDFSMSTGPNNDHRLSAGSLAGGGTFWLGQNELTVGGNNFSTDVTGVIADGGSGGGTGGALVKTGTGTMTLSGINTYSGATTVNGGVLAVNGSILASSGVTVNSGGTLAGTGIVGNTLVAGGIFAPGSGVAGTSTTVTGTLGLNAASTYRVDVNPATASFAAVSGVATLGGATVNASFAPGSYIARQYTILTAGSLNGTFGALTNTNLPANFTTALSYDAAHAYLDLTLHFTPPPGPTAPGFGTGLNRNQSNVANALINYFNSNGGIPLVFGTLNAQGLSQASGETAAGSQQTTFDAMNQFMGVMTDPFSAGRGAGGVGAIGFAAEDDGFNAYASTGRKRTGAERDAYAMLTKAPPRAPGFEAHWNVWAAGFGGSQTTDGHAVTGSNTTTSRLGGVAVGADYWLSPDTLAGFALAGGGTSFSAANGGSGRSDLFQAGAFLRHAMGSAYVSGAAAYGWQDITTERRLAMDGAQLRAQFNANAWSGRIEAGNRWVLPWLSGIGLTPYAAAQVTAFDLPAYAERAGLGTGTFALNYASQTATSTRSELGLRTDKSFAVGDAILTLRGRAAWAHDYNTDRAVSATFQALPGASFTVNGASPSRDAALTTASAEMRFTSGIALAGTFEGEFSDVTASYAGKGVVRYAW